MNLKNPIRFVLPAFLVAVVVSAGYFWQAHISSVSKFVSSSQSGQVSVAVSSFPSVGAIRWDSWCTGCNASGGTDEIALALNSPQWYDRLPFFSTISATGTIRIRLDDQALMDQEIAYAKAGGIDYWAFDYTGDTSNISKALNQYRASSRKADIKFSLVILPYAIQNNWPAAAVNHLKDSQYQTVLGGRPLVYVFRSHVVWERSTFDSLRSAAIAGGLPNPYIVWMTPDVKDGKMSELGLDAVSAYALHPPGLPEQVVPYADLANKDMSFWNTAKTVGLKLVPPVSTGWDPRPRYAYPPPNGVGSSTAVSLAVPPRSLLTYNQLLAG